MEAGGEENRILAAIGMFMIDVLEVSVDRAQSKGKVCFDGLE